MVHADSAAHLIQATASLSPSFTATNSLHLFQESCNHQRALGPSHPAVIIGAHPGHDVQRGLGWAGGAVGGGRSMRVRVEGGVAKAWYTWWV